MSAQRVLVVDDDPAILEFISGVLVDEGYEAVTTRNGKFALEAMVDFDPDLVILDMRMPIMDGPTFLESYRRVSPKPIPIIVLSAWPLLAPTIATFGSENFLSKPFDLEDLLNAVAHNLRVAPIQ
jgi:DNA-binding response OmpR family regulator